MGVKDVSHPDFLAPFKKQGGSDVVICGHVPLRDGGAGKVGHALAGAAGLRGVLPARREEMAQSRLVLP